MVCRVGFRWVLHHFSTPTCLRAKFGRKLVQNCQTSNFRQASVILRERCSREGERGLVGKTSKQRSTGSCRKASCRTTSKSLPAAAQHRANQEPMGLQTRGLGSPLSKVRSSIWFRWGPARDQRGASFSRFGPKHVTRVTVWGPKVDYPPRRPLVGPSRYGLPDRANVRCTN